MWVVLLSTYYSCKDCTPIVIPYEEEEQYETIEEVTEPLTYYKGQGRYERIMGYSLLGTNPRMHVSLPIRNTSAVGGVFSVAFEMESSQDAITIYGQNYIPPGETYIFDIEEEINPNTFMTNISLNTNVTAPLETQKRMVIKTRKVVNYKLCHPCEEDCSKS